MKKTSVVAIVAPGSYNNAIYDFNFSVWKPSGDPASLSFTREFEYDTDDDELLKSIEELQRIILALFLCDSVARKIYFFEYNQELSIEDRMKFWRVFGQPRAFYETQEQVFITSSKRIGLFNQKPLKKDTVTPEQTIKSWHEFLSQYPRISSSIQLIQESQGLAHELFAGLRIVDFAGLSTVLLLLVAGLESLFTNGLDSHADISFKFQTVGAAFYTKYVDGMSLKRDNPDSKGKFSYKDFKKILGILYGLRSDIAHGNFNLTFFDHNDRRKQLDKLFSLVGVGEVNKDMKSIYFAHLLITLGLLENHILEIFRSAKENLNKGVNILDEMLDNKINPGE